MWIMDIVWPVTALWAGPLGLWAYFRVGRRGPDKPFPEAVAVGATHCGAGCSLGDISAEWIHYAAPFTLAGEAIFGAWALDYALAILFGVFFQYFAIAPMRGLPFGKGMAQAFQADVLSLTA